LNRGDEKSGGVSAPSCEAGRTAGANEIPSQLQRIHESDELVSLLIGKELESPSGIGSFSVVTFDCVGA
jgi:hypothetical protein